MNLPRKSFVLADDDIDDIMLFCEAMKEVDSSIDCHTVNDGKELLDFLANKPGYKPDIIFLDINMPRMNGLQCLARLKEDEIYRDIPVFIYSTSESAKDADKAIDLGAVCFFAKPTEFYELKKVLKVIAANLENLLDAISHFHAIKYKKVFSCQE